VGVVFVLCSCCVRVDLGDGTLHLSNAN